MDICVNFAFWRQPFMFALRAVCRQRESISIHFRTSATATAKAATTSSTDSSESTKWSPNSIRMGVIARKRGMTAIWNNQGVRVPVTVLQVSNMVLF